jgi:hypothetical protein
VTYESLHVSVRYYDQYSTSGKGAGSVLFTDTYRMAVDVTECLTYCGLVLSTFRITAEGLRKSLRPSVLSNGYSGNLISERFINFC